MAVLCLQLFAAGQKCIWGKNMVFAAIHLIELQNLLRIFSFAILFAVSTAQVVSVFCDFNHTPSYTCNLRGLNFADDLSQAFVIGGNHLPGQSNSDVFNIYIEDSQTPFIVTQLFVSFPNAQVFKCCVKLQSTTIHSESCRLTPSSVRWAFTL